MTLSQNGIRFAAVQPSQRPCFSDTVLDHVESMINHAQLSISPPSTFLIYAAVIARLVLTPLCLLLNLCSPLTTSLFFDTASSPSVTINSMWHGLLMYGLIRPWARYVRRRCFGAWLTWMCLTKRLPVSRPLVSALASAFLSRPRRNSADFTGKRARETPNCLPRRWSC